MITFFHWLFKQQQQNQEEYYFTEMKGKVKSLEDNLSIWKKSCSKKEFFASDLIKTLEEQLKSINTYIQDIKIYIVFMGTMSSGKSTFINSLLGSQLLPSRNQNCTTQFLMITYGDTLIIGNNQQKTLEEATQNLFTLQKDQQLGFTNIQTPSVFHQKLQPDLRDRIIFIDTPGLKIGEESKFRKSYEDLDQMIGDHYRINIWIGNYTVFDNEKVLIYDIINGLKQKIEPEEDSEISETNFLDEMAQIEIQNRRNTNEKQQDNDNDKKNENKTKKWPELLLVLNKYDQKESQDIAIEEIIKDIEEKLGAERCCYKISAQDALAYQILNYGNDQSQQKFYKTYLKDFGDRLGIQTLKECKYYCDNTLKNNHNRIANQDFLIFFTQLQEQIKQQILSGVFSDLFTQAIETEALIELVLNSQISLKEDQHKLLLDFIDVQIPQLCTNYNCIISSFEDNTLSEIQNFNTSQLKALATSTNYKKIIEKTWNQILKFIAKFEAKVLSLNEEYQKIVLKKLNQIFSLSEPSKLQQEEILTAPQKLIQCCLKLYQSFSNQQLHDMQMKTNQQFCQNIKKVLGQNSDLLQKSVGAASLAGAVMAFLGRELLLQSLNIVAPGLGVAGLVLTTINFKALFSKKNKFSIGVAEQIMCHVIITTATRLEGLCDINKSVHKQTLYGIKNILEGLVCDKN